MSIKASTKARNMQGGVCSVKRMLTGGKLQLWTNSQNASADSAQAGTKVIEYTLSGGAHTAEVLSRGSVTLTGGAAGSVDQIAVDSVNLLAAAVPFNSTLAQTAADVAAAINANETNPDYVASASGAKIIIEALPGTGTGPNGLTVSTTVTTITKTDVNMGTEQAGVASVNGLTWGGCIDGVLSKAGVWSGTVLSTGTVASFVLTGSIADDNSDDSSNKKFIRITGTVGVGAGYDMSVASTLFTSGEAHSINTFTLTMPA